MLRHPTTRVYPQLAVGLAAVAIAAAAAGAAGGEIEDGHDSPGVSWRPAGDQLGVVQHARTP
jgi:hypothetical protein